MLVKQCNNKFNLSNNQLSFRNKFIITLTIINDDEFIFKDENGSIIRSIDISIDEYDNLIQYFELILEQINEMNEKLT